MIELLLVRYYTPLATFGVLTLPGGDTVYTIERPWARNKPRVSCIPEGTYPLVPDTFNKPEVPYPTWAIPDGEVPGGRTLIKIHRANRARELAGCIAPGLAIGVLDGEWAILSSKPAHDRLMAALHGVTEARLRIVQYRPEGMVPAGASHHGADSGATRPLM